MRQPLVSVIMAVRDGERWLGEACGSILAQSLRDVELIVVDDGSSDGSADILEEISRRDARLRVHRQDGRGLVAALNVGVAMARAPLLARLDADDVAMPDRLCRQAEYMERSPRVVLLGSWAERMDAAGRTTGYLRPRTDCDVLAAMLSERNPFIHSSVMMRKAALVTAGVYREACRGAEDYDLWLRLAECGAVANLPEVLVRYRWHQNSVTRRYAVRQCFSARIARRAAASRRATGIDPLAGLDTAPDWWADDVGKRFYAEDARLCRFLDAGSNADNEDGRQRASRTEIPKWREIASLPSPERALARQSAIGLLRHASRRGTARRRNLVAIWLAALAGRRLSSQR